MVFTHDSVEFFFKLYNSESLRVHFNRISAIGQLHQPICIYSNVSTNHRALFKNVKKMFLELFIVLANGKLASSLFPKIILRQ